MVNYNLYQGCDAIVCVAEDHRNSIRVLNQIQQVADRLETPFYAIWNRAKSTQIPESLLEFSDRLLGQVPLDDAIEDFDYDALNEQTKIQVKLIWQNLLEKAKKPSLQPTLEYV